MTHPEDRPESLGTVAITMLLLGALGLAGLVLSGSGCKVPPPNTVGGRVVSCTTQAVRDNWPAAIGPVNSCLVSASASACLLALIRPLAGITEDVVACLVRDQGSEFAHAAQANPGDTRSATAAANARNYLAEQGYTFADGGR
jgi:hypothetical protein